MIIRPHDLANGENPAARPLQLRRSDILQPGTVSAGYAAASRPRAYRAQLDGHQTEKGTLASHLALRRRERAALWRAGAFCRNPERSEGISKRKKADHISMIGLYFMPATTYSPTHFRVQYNRPCGA